MGVLRPVIGPRTPPRPKVRVVVVETCRCGASYQAGRPDAAIYAAWVAAHAGCEGGGRE